VYQALLDPDAIALWRVPAGMKYHIHEFDAREGGAFRISLTYDASGQAGKSAAHTDTDHDRFATLAPNWTVPDLVDSRSWPATETRRGNDHGDTSPRNTRTKP
jgi:hypothetical protein